MSQVLFLTAFLAYVGATILFIVRLAAQRRHAPAAVTGRRVTVTGRVAAVDGGGSGLAFTAPPPATDDARWASHLTAAAVAVHGAAIGLRWLASGQAPMSNMYEYMGLMGWATMFFFVLINRRYNVPALGAFVAPVGILVIAYASLFPSQVQPLVPALQSYWLVLHVTLAALGEGAFAVSFGAALMYLLRAHRSGDLSPLEQTGLETLLGAVAVLGGFIGSALLFRLAGYEVLVPQVGGAPLVYNLPPLTAPAGVAPGSLGSLAGLPLPLFAAPTWMGGLAAGRKLNTLIWALATGAAVYWALRLAVRRPWRDLLGQPLAGLSPDTLDDLSYRGIALGFPLFTLGGMVFAMIWAQKAWGSYWSWDPKETWSLISWLFYAGYLHMRIVRGWEGKAAAWTAATGFVVILFTLVGVNLLISGLHSYAGG